MGQSIWCYRYCDFTKVSDLSLLSLVPAFWPCCNSGQRTGRFYSRLIDAPLQDSERWHLVLISVTTAKTISPQKFKAFATCPCFCVIHQWTASLDFIFFCHLIWFFLPSCLVLSGIPITFLLALVMGDDRFCWLPVDQLSLSFVWTLICFVSNTILGQTIIFCS